MRILIHITCSVLKKLVMFQHLPIIAGTSPRSSAVPAPVPATRNPTVNRPRLLLLLSRNIVLLMALQILY